mgnify:CR=1 FL=1
MSLNLTILPERFAVCRLQPGADFGEPAARNSLFALTRTTDELSLVCSEAHAPREALIEPGWRAFKVTGPLDFALTGILASLANPLADNGVGIFAVSTYDTDYVLVKETDLQRAVQALRAAGHWIHNSGNI